MLNPSGWLRRQPSFEKRYFSLAAGDGLTHLAPGRSKVQLFPRGARTDVCLLGQAELRRDARRSGSRIDENLAMRVDKQVEPFE